MKLPRLRPVHLARAGGAALFMACGLLSGMVDASSQAKRAIKIIVPYPAGGAADTLVRALADSIGRAQDLTIVIEDRPGATGDIGTEIASRAAPDGKTLLVVGNPFVMNPHLRKLAYDPLTGFEPICQLTTTPSVIAVNAASPYRTLGDLFDAARAKPGSLTLASIGPASAVHIAFETLKRAAKVDMTFVPYPGTSLAVSALLGDHVTSFFGNYTDVGEQIKAGSLRAVAVASEQRIEALPNVPIIAESGYAGFALDVWFGVLAPAKTPKDTVSELAHWFTAALHAPEMSSKLALQGLYPVDRCGADFAALVRNQYDEYGRDIRALNIKAP